VKKTDTIPVKSGEEVTKELFPEKENDVKYGPSDPVNDGAWKLYDEAQKGRS